MSPALGAMEENLYTKGVLLEPFVHQVGGHSCVLCFNEKTLCKPLIQRECQFYESLPSDMQKFTPKYKGVVSVNFEEDGHGNLSLIAYPLSGDQIEIENIDNMDCEPQNKPLKWSNKKPVLLENDNRSKERVRQHRKEDNINSHEEMERLKKSEVLRYSIEKKGNISSQSKHNPWTVKCQQHLKRMKENAKHQNQYKFILLENLTSRYEVPCVLDLKMGTRQHGDDASAEKAANQIRKCQQSTSAVIGVRVCGMQVYQTDSGQLMFMNKYHGRKLSVQGFKEALYQFFHNGKYLRRELFDPVLRKLLELKTVLEKQESYRFYSSSLLIIYDGKEVQRVAADSDQDSEDLSEDSADESAGAHAYKCSSGTADVRMIDFAHTTCKYYGEDSVRHEGQDTGYIFGLQNLISIVKEIRDDSGE
ncbi:inositol hexakisphosphate kinase 2 [Protopterus annectens]|uniref:inositol hexakisphosphate kinase 2 n=1 Tax=Protopterus annectens TaxID=7888 RepID=UPI001CFA4E9F|nr:inositol hexakisphosphate kinase 2 [Protopterus annectens]XP_043934522.1 inositol hexakisphosphate kinase 2 [Protopterus annectens]XP_043934523.1 inositol hexakisphosphate kinase 2 [Protopterus annectens]